MSRLATSVGKATESYDVVVVGAGFAGMYTLHQAARTGSFRRGSMSRAAGVGGTWYWNRYPARAATSRACNAPIRSRKSCSRNGTRSER